jgi:hypothetical protein
MKRLRAVIEARLQKISHSDQICRISAKLLKIQKPEALGILISGSGKREYCVFGGNCNGAILYGCRIRLLWLLGNDYRSVRGTNKSFYSLDRRAENAADLASA